MRIPCAAPRHTPQSDRGRTASDSGRIARLDSGTIVRLVGNAAPWRYLPVEDPWVDPHIGTRTRHAFKPKRFAIALADGGGFGMGDAPDTLSQAHAGIGYRSCETCAVQGGYRALAVQRGGGGQDIALDLSGPMIGIPVSC